MKIFVRGISIEEARQLLAEELELARKLAEKQARLHFGTIENENKAMIERWNFINQRLDRLEESLKRQEIIDA